MNMHNPALLSPMSLPMPKTSLPGWLSSVRKELNSSILEAPEIIDAGLTALIARQHVCLIGPKGTAKSALARRLAEYVDGRYFERLMSQFEVPDGVFGPPDILALQQGRYERNLEGRMAEAHVTFLDEVWKANGAMLNALLGALNERQFEGTGIPLVTCIGASNELPAGVGNNRNTGGESLEALWDRWHLRLFVHPLQEEDNIMQVVFQGGIPARKITACTQTDLEELHRQASNMTWTKTARDSYAKIWRDLKKQGILPSVRRLVASKVACGAYALVLGMSKVTNKALGILKHMLWEIPSEMDTVKAIIEAEAALSAMTQFEAAKKAVDAEINTLRNAVRSNSAAVAKNAAKNLGERIKIAADRAKDAEDSTEITPEESMRLVEELKRVKSEAAGLVRQIL